MLLTRLALKIVVLGRQEARVKKLWAILLFFTHFGFIVFTYLHSHYCDRSYSDFQSYKVHLSPLIAPPSIPPQRGEEKDKLLILEGVGGGVLVPGLMTICYNIRYIILLPVITAMNRNSV